jgi:hypothetical protein
MVLKKRMDLGDAQFSLATKDFVLCHSLEGVL